MDWENVIREIKLNHRTKTFARRETMLVGEEGNTNKEIDGKVVVKEGKIVL